tara:strand:+ start:3305 stop:3820 length:516 start_codon:yes stop_codon:yes gene_type:complete
MAKLTEAELRKIIQEELEGVDEGFLDRWLSKAGGKAAGVGGGLSNIKKAIAQSYKGQKPSGRVEVDKIEKYTTALNLMKKKGQKIAPQLKDMEDDIKAITGREFEKDFKQLKNMSKEDKEKLAAENPLATIQAFEDIIRIGREFAGQYSELVTKMKQNLQNMKRVNEGEKQ